MYRRLLMTLLAVAFGCGESGVSGSSGLNPIPPIDTTGTWSGTWVGNNGSGPIEFTLVQTDPAEEGTSDVMGTATFTGFRDGSVAEDCFSSGSFVGKIFVDTGGITVDGISILNTPQDTPNGILEIQLDGELQVLGNLMTGSYVVTKGQPRSKSNEPPVPNCKNFTGTLELTRSVTP